MRKLLTTLAFAFAIFVGIKAYIEHDAAQNDYLAAQSRILQARADKAVDLVLSDLSKLRRLPPQIADLDRLKILTILNTQVSDFSALATLPQLSNLTISSPWLIDLDALAQIPNLERLQVLDSEIISLSPLAKAPALDWVNLYRTYARDGSAKVYKAMANRGVDMNQSTAIQTNYKPDQIYQLKTEMARWKMFLGFGDKPLGQPG